MKNRRTTEGYKLRVYIDAIKDVKSMTNEEWANQSILRDGPYLTRLAWLGYLEQCALIEADKLLRLEAA